MATSQGMAAVGIAAVVAALVAVSEILRSPEAQSQGALALVLDTEPNTAGIQSTLSVGAGASFCIAVTIEGSPANIGAIDFEVEYDQTFVDAPEVVAGNANIENDNPDLNNAPGDAASTCPGVTETGYLNPAGWDCTGVGTTEPRGDTDGDHADFDGTAKLGCFKAGSTSGSGTGVLAYVRFTPLAGTAGSLLTLANVTISDALANEIGSCNPTGITPIGCGAATISVSGATPIPTGTATATGTATSTPTPTGTPCPSAICPRPTLPPPQTATPSMGGTAPTGVIAIAPPLCFWLSLNVNVHVIEILQLYSKCHGMFAPGSLEILGDCDHQPGDCTLQTFGDNDGTLEPSDYARMEGDGNQVRQRSPQGFLWVAAFVAADGPVRFATDRGNFLTEINELTHVWQCDNTNAPAERDEDCDDDGVRGDGIVVARLTGIQTGHIVGTAFMPDTFADLGAGTVTVQQGQVLESLPFTIVGEPDRVEVTALETHVQIGAGDNNNDGDTSDVGECPFRPESFLDDSATAERALLFARVFDSAGTAITGAFVDWSTNDERIGVTATGLVPTTDLGTSEIGAANVLCGAAAPGDVTVHAELVAELFGFLAIDPTACGGHPPPCPGDDVTVSVVEVLPTATPTSTPTPASTHTPTSAPPSTSTPATGCAADLNHDGNVTGRDVAAVARALFSEDADADLNHDGRVDLIDLKLVIKAMHARVC